VSLSCRAIVGVCSRSLACAWHVLRLLSGETHCASRQFCEQPAACWGISRNHGFEARTVEDMLEDNLDSMEPVHGGTTNAL
jgi:hypothetical protein